nr:proteasome subunit y [Theileria orientalis]
MTDLESSIGAYSNVEKLLSNENDFLLNSTGVEKHPGGVDMGTTIIAMKFNDGVLLAADSRTSSGQLVVNRVARKITRILPSVFMLRSGSAADSQTLSTILRYHAQSLRHQLRRGGRGHAGSNLSMDVDTNDSLDNVTHTYKLDDTVQGPPIKALATVTHNLVHQYRNALYCGVILGGYDFVNGPEIYNITLGGTLVEIEDFLATGSGSGFIVAYLQSNYKKNMNRDECLSLLKKAIEYAVLNDNSSGGIMRAVSVSRTAVNEYYFVL